MRNLEISCRSFEEGYCRTKDLLIHYTRTGTGKPPIVLLHGLAANGMCWKRIAQGLSDHFDAIMPDARGYGKSGVPDEGYTYEVLKSDLIAFLSEMNLSNVVLVGHSMGGLTAAMAACQSPLIRAVILADPTFLSLERQREVWESDVIGQHRKMLAKSVGELIADRKNAHPDRSDECNERIAAARLQTSIKAFGILAPTNPDYRQIVKQIGCPCLLLYGERGIISDEQAEGISKMNSLVRAEKIRNAGHGIYLDQPVQFVNSIIKFVEDAEREA